MMRFNKWAAIATIFLATTACQTTGPKQQTSAVVGAIAGGVIGNQIGSGSGRAAATVAGVVLGGLIGSQIGSALDEADRQAALEAEYRALEYGRPGAPVAWNGPNTNNYGEIIPSQPYQGSTGLCRDYTHTIYVGGRPEVARGTACRNPDGTWTTIS